MKSILLACLVTVTTLPCLAQNKKLAVIGSSTAFGTGAQPIDSSWVRRLNYYYKYQLGTVDTVFNLALGGYDPYHGLPTWYTPGPFYSTPDPQRNITRANSLAPDVIIVSFVSNGFQVGGMATDSIMKALQIIKDSANKEGRVCFISSSQPRTGFDAPSRERLRVIKDSIVNRFGFYAINLFDSLVNPVDNTILPQYAYAFDNIHLNNAGHALIFRQILAKDIFNTTVNRTRMSGEWNNPATWDKGIIPTELDSVAVLPGHTLSFNSSANIRGLSIAAGGTVSINATGIQVRVGNNAVNNKNVTVNGSLTIANGRLLIHGGLSQREGSNFLMTGGELVIDGNNGTSAGSVADGTHLFEVASNISGFSFTGGTLQIIDPPFGANSESIKCTGFNFGENTILKLGNGVSTTASNQLNGFGGSLLPLQIGELVLDAASNENNRHFKNVNPLTISKSVQVLSGRLIQAAALNVQH